MRVTLCLLVLLLASAPAASQGHQGQPKAPAPKEAIQVPPGLTDPATADRLVDAMKAMSQAFLSLPVGEVEAALEGRAPTPADRSRTVRSESGLAEAELKQQIEASRPVMQAGMKALAAALPAMLEGLAGAGRELERAATNVPRPDYPKR